MIQILKYVFCAVRSAWLFWWGLVLHWTVAGGGSFQAMEVMCL